MTIFLAIYFCFGWYSLGSFFVMDFSSLNVAANGGFGIHTRQWGIMVWQWHRQVLIFVFTLAGGNGTVVSAVVFRTTAFLSISSHAHLISWDAKD